VNNKRIQLVSDTLVEQIISGKKIASVALVAEVAVRAGDTTIHPSFPVRYPVTCERRTWKIKETFSETPDPLRIKYSDTKKPRYHT
jgi:hypothetical protein